MVTSTMGSTPRLSEAARHLVFPSTIRRSVFPRVEDRLRKVGVEFDPWQHGFGTIALGLDESGKYAATVGGVVASIPRQVGKTFTVGHLLIGLCLEFPALRVMWTSHHLRTTGNTFRSMQGMVRKKRVFVHVEAIRLVNGEQEIHFKNGSVIMFGARALGFGRGMDKIDVEVFDEAQILPLRALEDMVPATNQAQNPHGGLLFFIGTPPRPTDEGESFIAKRQQALEGNADDDMVYVEFSADKDAKPDDRSQWPVMNPSYPSRTPLESMLRMRKNMPDEDSWRREAMGIWDEVLTEGVITSEQWRDALDVDSVPLDPVAFGIYVNLPRTMAAIGVAGRREDGKFHVGIVPAVRGQDMDTLPGTGWIPGRIKELVEQWSPSAVVVDGHSGAASLIPQIEDEDVEVTVTNARDMTRAANSFYDAVVEDGLRHQGSKSLSRAVVSAKRRELSDSWAWDRRDKTSDITQLVAVTLALHGLVNAGEDEVKEPQVHEWPEDIWEGAPI